VFIGIFGASKSGKEELCEILCKTYGFQRVSLSSKIKELAIKYFNVTPEDAEIPDKKTKQILEGIRLSIAIPNETRNLLVEKIKQPEPIIGSSGFPIWVESQMLGWYNIEPLLLTKKRQHVKNILNGIYNMWAESLDEFLTISPYGQYIWLEYLFHSLTNQDGLYIIDDIQYKHEKQYIEKICGKVIKIVRMDNIEVDFTTNLSTETEWNYILANEHKSDWQNRLVLSTGNMVRKFVNEKFFTQNQIDNFKINLNEYF